MLAGYLKSEAAELLPRLYSGWARVLETAKAAIDRLLDRAYGMLGLVMSIAEPDRLARHKDARARDHVAELLMRKKRYAVVGIRNRFEDRSLSLSPAQRQHSLQTLALLTGRKFHREPGDRMTSATRWLAKHIR